MAPAVFAELAEAEVVVEVFCCTEEGLAVVGEREVAVLQLVAEGRKEDMLRLLARMPIDLYQYESNDAGVRDSSQKEGNGNFHTRFSALGSCMYIRIEFIVRGIKMVLKMTTYTKDSRVIMYASTRRGVVYGQILDL